MFEIKTLDDVRGNNVVVYSISTLLARNNFPKLSILAGVMGVGKTSVAKIVADKLNKSETPVKVYNCGLMDDMSKVQEEVFSMNPMQPRAFIFEELHTLSRANQNSLLQMFDSQSPNVYIICTTTELSKILRTIRSRARVWEFKLLSDKQLSQLLDDYLKTQGATLSVPAKQTLLRSCHGVPRDLIKNTDFALDGEFNANQLDTLLGNVSDELCFSIFSSLKSRTVDFVAHIEDLIDDTADNKLSALSDFWLRFLLERSSEVRTTLTSEMIRALDKIFTPSDITKVTKVLLRATSETLLLELVHLNMTLTATTSSTVLGHQIDKSQRMETETRVQSQARVKQSDTVGGKITVGDVKAFKL